MAAVGLLSVALLELMPDVVGGTIDFGKSVLQSFFIFIFLLSVNATTLSVCPSFVLVGQEVPGGKHQ